jgi:predicted DNA-binding transcriptional regulator YafY
MNKDDMDIQLARIVEIDRAIRTIRFPTLERILNAVRSKNLETSRPTFQRDMKMMKDEGARIKVRQSKPAETDGARLYYYAYEDPNYKYEIDGVTLKDIQTIALARELLEHYRGVPTAEELSKTYDRLLDLSDGITPEDLPCNTASPISFSIPPQPPIKPDVWKTCLEAIRNRETLLFHYKKGWKAKPANDLRRVDPYRILNLNGIWYLIATASLGDDSIRQYNMARIDSVKPAGVHFKVPENKQRDVKAMIENAFGSFLGDPKALVEVTVEFSARIHPLITERKFHVRETRKELPGGGTRISFPVSASGPWPFYHVISWILSWGRDATVVSPPELIKLVENEIRLMAMM